MTPAAVGETVETVVASSVAAAGVRTVFGVLGEGCLAVVDALVHREGVRYIATSREDGAVLAADGYARVGGGFAAAAITSGPALTNAVTALTEAARARTPMLVLVGDTPPGDLANPQRIDQAAVVAPTGAGFVRLRAAETAADDVAAAIRMARTQRLPVVLDMPVNLFGLPSTRRPQVGDPTSAAGQRLRPDPAAIATAAEALGSARRPVILAGRGAVLSGARSALVRLAETLRCPLATTLPAKGLFAGHPQDVGVCGGFSYEQTAVLLASADCILAVGAGLNGHTTDGGRLITAQCQVIQLDNDPSVFGQWRPADVTVVGDARESVRELARLLLAPASTWDLEWTTTTTPRSDGILAELRRSSDTAAPHGLDLHRVVRILDAALPPDRLVVADGGHAAVSEPARTMHVNRAGALAFPLHFGSIGLSLATALGAAVGAAASPVVSFIGDGGFAMAVAELATITAEQLPILVVVLNDRAYGWEYHQMRDRGMDLQLSLFPRADFAAVGSAFGLRGVRIESEQALLAEAEQFAHTPAPTLLDVQLDRDVRTDWFDERFGAARPAGSTA